MVSVLLILVAMSVFQLGLALHVRNTVLSCASEGARLGARAGATSEDAVATTASLLASALSPAYAEGVSVRSTSVAGVQVLEVTAIVPMPVIGLLGPADAMTISGRAFREDQ